MKISTKNRSEQLQNRHSVAATKKKNVLPRLKHLAAEAKKAAAIAAAEKQCLAEAAASNERRREQECRQQSSAPDRCSKKAIRRRQPNGCVAWLSDVDKRKNVPPRMLRRKHVVANKLRQRKLWNLLRWLNVVSQQEQ